MPQNVPTFQFSPEALRRRQFLYEYWCARGHGPNLRAAHEATGLGRRELIAATASSTSASPAPSTTTPRTTIS
jgi:hypothetical protein